MTPDETPAACARPDRVQASPSAASFEHAGARRGHALRHGSVRCSPSVQGSGSKAAGARSSMRATMPGGDSV